MSNDEGPKNQSNDNNVEEYEFQAEIQRVLDIIINRLYKDREIFLRELVSNSADALNKIRFKSLSKENQEILDDDVELEILIEADEDKKVIEVVDTGIGMTKDEIITNLGTIAQSGTLKFLEEMSGEDGSGLIGQFGVGFYSAFMVSDKVEVITKSYIPSEPAIIWTSDGSGKFTVKESDKKDRGTIVRLFLKDDAEEFVKNYRIKQIIKKYSDFVSFPIKMEEEEGEGDDKKVEYKTVNQKSPIWHRTDVEETEYNEFYKQLTFDFQDPLSVVPITVEAPIQFKALLYIPKSSPSRTLMTPQADWGLKLYSKKILIQEKSKDLVPEYLRFIQGVVDSEDIPLNVSREVVQVDKTLRRIKKVITGRVLKQIEKVSKEREEDYNLFWNEYKGFIKEGIINQQDEKIKNRIIELIRVKTSKSEDKEKSLKEYVKGMNTEKGQDKIYYLVGSSIDSVKHSPHLDWYKENEMEVIYFTEPIDSFMLMNLSEYEKMQFVSIDSEVQKEEKKPSENEEETEESKKEEPKDKLLYTIKETLGEKIADVRYSERLTSSMSRLVNPQGAGTAFHRVMGYMNEKYSLPARILEINPNHKIVLGLKALVENDEQSELTKAIIGQILDNNLIEEGTLETTSEMIQRVNKIIEHSLE